ncbi:Nuclear pore complex nucleoporin component [Borealophlyctis nickersoniae]|nr:Nuclear pore complex nucleoporin component [Borealophlyctis nickersoniae]
MPNYCRTPQQIREARQYEKEKEAFYIRAEMLSIHAPARLAIRKQLEDLGDRAERRTQKEFDEPLRKMREMCLQTPPAPDREELARREQLQREHAERMAHFKAFSEQKFQKVRETLEEIRRAEAAQQSGVDAARVAAEKAAAEQKQREEEQRKLEQDQKAAEAAKKVADAAQAAQAANAAPSGSRSSVSGPDPSLVAPKAWEDASKYLSLVLNIKKSRPPNSQVFDQCMFQITEKIGQITASETKIIEIARQIDGVLIKGRDASTATYEASMDIAAKQLVKQSETEVAVRVSHAFPLALLAILLYRKHTRFLDILLGRLIKRCAYIVPMYTRKQPNETNDELRKRAGYRKNDNGWETEEQFGERMAGIIAFYAAIVQTKAVPHSYGMQHGWTWLARILNLKPRRITPLLVFRFLEIAGHELLKDYGAQARKIIQFIMGEYMGVIGQMAKPPTASANRLLLFLQDNLKAAGTIPPHEGRTLEK